MKERIGMPRKKLQRLLSLAGNPGHKKDAIGKRLLRLAAKQKKGRKRL